MAYPANVRHIAIECGYRNHPAAFPVAFPEWFIRLFTDEGDRILDPFIGPGTTLVAAVRNARMGIGVELDRDYCRLIEQLINTLPPIGYQYQSGRGSSHGWIN